MSEIEVLDPATAEQIGSIEDMDEAAVDAAVRRARTTFDEGDWWPRTPDEERGRILARAAGLVRRDAAELARLETRDVGKPLAESEGDVEDGHIECWLHGSLFDLRTGAPTGLPAVRPVPTYPVTVEGDDVLVQMES